jgi:uncharacterized membrane protein (DUF373 family)
MAPSPLPKFGITLDDWKAMTFYGRFEQVVSWVLALAISAVILVAVYRLIADVLRFLVRDALDPLDHDVFQMIFGAIMTLLIAMEFGHSILHTSARLKSVVQVRTVLLVSMLAVARKFIVLDTQVVSAATILGLSSALLASGAVYWLLRQSDDRRKSPGSPPPA